VIKINHELLRDDLTIDEALMLQIKYQKIILNQKEKREKSHFTIGRVKWLVGVDISYFREENQEFGVSCAVLWNLRKNKIETYSTAKNLIKFAYKPGFLGFRECNLISKAIIKLQKKIDLIICDGHGLIHPRRFGEAVQLGFALNIPSIGVAKNPFIGYSEWKNLQKKKGQMVPIWANDPKITTESSQELLGYAICLNDGSKPVFISSGYKTPIKLAIEITLNTTINYRIPEPLYWADKFSREKIKLK
jgi:deoxyribonuclease V